MISAFNDEMRLATKEGENSCLMPLKRRILTCELCPLEASIWTMSNRELGNLVRKLNPVSCKLSTNFEGKVSVNRTEYMNRYE